MSQSGRLLCKARHGAGLSQRGLGDLTGVAPTLISAYENGRRTPGGDVLMRLLEACGVAEPTVPDRPGEALLRAAAGLEQVAALAMALPRREAGPLRFPSFRTFAPDR